MKRDKVIDLCKGIGIFLVVLGHVIHSDATIFGVNTNNIIYVFHMPLFFIISGILLSYSLKEGTPKSFIAKKTRGIMVPYFVFSAISFVYWAAIEIRMRPTAENIVILDVLKNIFLMRVDGGYLVPNIVLWFLPCLFFSQIIFYCIYMTSKKRICRIIMSCLCFFIGIALSTNNIILPLSIETALVSVLFLDFGYEIANLLNRIKVSRHAKIFAGIFGFLLYSVALSLNGDVSMLGHNYGNPLLFIAGALGGFLLIYLAALSLSCLNMGLSRFVSFIGRNSIAIMLIHEPIKRAVIYIISKMTFIGEGDIRYNFLYSLVTTIVVVLLLVPFIVAINKWTPSIIGAKNKKHANA